MKDRNVIAWDIISLFGFWVINFLMTQSFVTGSGQENSMTEFWHTSLLALLFYAIPIVMAALNWRLSFYLMGLIMALYTLAPVGVILTMWYGHADIMVRLGMALASLAVIAANAYWLVLALRLRKAEREREDRRRFQK